jgi:hypothetical protein
MFGARGARGKGKRGKWIECGLLVVLGRRGKEEEQTWARDTAAARWRPGGAQVGVARAGKASRGGKRDRGRGRPTRGVCSSRRWRRGGAGATLSGADNRRQGSRGAEQGARGRRRGEGVRGTRLQK